MARTKSGVQRWSTAEAPQPERADFFAAALSEAAVPFGVDRVDAAHFHADVAFGHLDAIGIYNTAGAPHRSFRGGREITRTENHSFFLIVLHQGRWTAKHRGSVRMQPGDVLIHDTRYPFENDVLDGFRAVCVSFSENWLRGWFPDPDTLGGTRVARASPWGSALSSYLAGLSPELATSAALPAAVLSDQVGSLLALATSNLRAAEPMYNTRASRQLHERIQDCILQRCTEPQLTAAHIASSLKISVRTLHRTLATTQETFSMRLIQSRAQIAQRMLRSALFNRVTTAEIGRRAGFMSSSHFARVMRKRTGLTPLQLRHSDARTDTGLQDPIAVEDP